MKRNEKKDLNYETIIDSFMPHREKILVERPIHPERRLEEYELGRLYEEIWERFEKEEQSEQNKQNKKKELTIGRRFQV